VNFCFSERATKRGFAAEKGHIVHGLEVFQRLQAATEESTSVLMWLITEGSNYIFQKGMQSSQ
jgi:hypothetical protein